MNWPSTDVATAPLPCAPPSRAGGPGCVWRICSSTWPRAACVGWVERSDTHHSLSHCLLGIAALHPTYPSFPHIAHRPSPVRRPADRGQASGDLGEHCSSSAAGHGVCGPPGRVAQHPQGVRRGCMGLKPQQHTQPPREWARARARAAAAHRDGLSLVTFFARAKKVTGMPGRPRRKPLNTACHSR